MLGEPGAPTTGRRPEADVPWTPGNRRSEHARQVGGKLLLPLKLWRVGRCDGGRSPPVPMPHTVVPAPARPSAGPAGD
ncbi:protein of unknown function [Candidatus Hydrogenisulfobacillus filiaventi]|uniref:Uncharacterized protein n=1 Tax=Candidatus Hydrogenisulfobacillus filiaventi TaxID=2707344 RepID=A0A6F8ZIE1_9FIRM|nr:protein of unknown function [Candidatus Hydrogenisulfobacillus filiaventi]